MGIHPDYLLRAPGAPKNPVTRMCLFFRQCNENKAFDPTGQADFPEKPNKLEKVCPSPKPL
jgi:hypothetical protein